MYPEKREGAPDATGTPSQNKNVTMHSVSDQKLDVNPCLRLRDIRQKTGAMAKDAALVVREKFPKFNRQLLAQCEAWDKYGVVLHPDGLRAMCEAYGVPVPEEKKLATAPAPPPERHFERERPGEGQNQCDRILRHFRDYGSITSLEAMQEYGIMRLASRITDLKRRGYIIAAVTETSKNRYGESTSYARYSLVSEPPKEEER